MKRLLIAVSLLATAAAPAMAQSFDPNLGTGNIAPGPGSTFVWAVPVVAESGPLAAYNGPVVPEITDVRHMPIYLGNELVWPLPGAAVAAPYPYRPY
ncbi:MAG TPA: hypothetical protein VG986_07800 [Pseudolabrys sp.]|nr:hypothetical protein [Pseudolabrys sp.]